MTGVITLLPVLLVLLAQSPDRGNERRQVPAPPALTPEGAPSAPPPATPGEKAFSGLFTKPAPAQGLERDRRQAFENQKLATRIVCGMVVIEADPSIDPKILVPPPADSGTSKIRRIVPEACTE